MIARQYYTGSKPQHTNNIAHSCIFIYVDNYLLFQGNRLPTLLSQNVFLPVSMTSPLTRPFCEVSDVESGISAIISMAIDSCCGKQRIRGLLQNRACHQQRFPLFQLSEVAESTEDEFTICWETAGEASYKENVNLTWVYRIKNLLH